MLIRTCQLPDVRALVKIGEPTFKRRLFLPIESFGSPAVERKMLICLDDRASIDVLDLVPHLLPLAKCFSA
jgi:hypothetical protein